MYIELHMDPHLLLGNLLQQCVWLMMDQGEEFQNSFAECPGIILGGDKALVELFHIIFLFLPNNLPSIFKVWSEMGIPNLLFTLLTWRKFVRIMKTFSP